MKQTVSGNIKCFDISCSDEDIEKSMNRKSILDTILEEKDKEIERLNNIIYREISNYILKKYGMLDDTHYHDFLNELELKEIGNNEHEENRK